MGGKKTSVRVDLNTISGVQRKLIFFYIVPTHTIQCISTYHNTVGFIENRCVTNKIPPSP